MPGTTVTPTCSANGSTAPRGTSSAVHRICHQVWLPTCRSHKGTNVTQSAELPRRPREASVPDSDSAVTNADTFDAKVLLSVLAEVKAGDFSARMPLEWTGVAG